MKERTVQSALDVTHLQKLPQVDSYYDKVHQRAYAERWGGYVSGMMYGGALGGVVGAIGVFIPSLFGGAVPGLAAIGQSAALFASMGTVVGTSIATQVGVTSGAVAAGFEEHERREKLEKIREKSPEMAAKIEQAIDAKAEAQRPKNGWDRFKMALKRSFNWPLVGVGVVAGLVFGAIFAVNPASNFAIEAMKGFLPVAENSTLRFLTLASLGGLVGGVFSGFMGSAMSNVIGNATRPIYTGAVFKEKQKSVTPEIDLESPQPARKFSNDKEAQASYCQNVTEKRQQVALNLGVL